MNIFKETKALVKKEKSYTTQTLKNLAVIEKDKLYCDLNFPSLYKYLIIDLGYSHSEATYRIEAVRLMNKSKFARRKILDQEMSLSNAALINRHLNRDTPKTKTDELLLKASSSTHRQLQTFIDQEFNRERKEVLVLREGSLRKYDRLKRRLGNHSTFELTHIMLERELKRPGAPRKPQKNKDKSPKIQPNRHIPASLKREVYQDYCQNCGVQVNLEYDHIHKFSHGGKTSCENLQILCRNCNQRKEIKARQSGFFS